jgi:ligand-binding SRPBCC domain-containing protein
VDSAGSTGETAIDLKTSGLMSLGERVTWSAVHFGIRQRLTVEIVQFDRPHSFTDEMVSGAFKSMCHLHEFECSGHNTVMKDYFEFEAPLGFLGTIAENLILRNYMSRFLKVRNSTLKSLAEGSDWQKYLQQD